jgi:hypothetical protein
MGKGILPQQCFCRMQRQRQRHYSGSLRQLHLRHMLNSFYTTVVGVLKYVREVYYIQYIAPHVPCIEQHIF